MFFIIYLLGFVDTNLALPRRVEPYFLLRVTALFFCFDDDSDNGSCSA